jgi:hypothetical protein
MWFASRDAMQVKDKPGSPIKAQIPGMLSLTRYGNQNQVTDSEKVAVRGTVP